MQLKIQRSQRTGGMLGGTAIFCLDARAQLTTAQQQSVRKYQLNHQILYSSEAAKKHHEKAAAGFQESRSWDAATSAKGLAKGLASTVLAHMKLNITIESLQRGQHIECKDLEEMLDAESALMKACENLKSYLDIAATFDGREVLIDYSGQTPSVIASSAVVQTAAPPPAQLPPPAVEVEPTAAPTFQSMDGAAAITADEYPQFVPAAHPAIANFWDSKTPVQQVALIAVGVAILLFVSSVLFR